MTEISFYSVEERGKNHYILPHAHTCHEIVFYGRSCRGKTLIGDTEYDMRPGSVAVIPKGVLHEEQHLVLTRVTFFGFQMPELELCGVYPDMWQLKPLFDDIIHEVRAQEYQYDRLVALKLQEILTYLDRKDCGAQLQVKDLSYCKRYIEENYMQKINMGALAQMTGYSYDHFRHLYTEKFGISPQRDLIDTRLANAVQLLKNTTLSCTEIAYLCGFSDSGQLTKMMKTGYGLNPSAIRKGGNR